MKTLRRKALRPFLWLATVPSVLILVPAVLSLNPEIKPVSLGDLMPNITLPTYQGGELSLAGLKGKNVMIIFPRGYAAEGRWCTICNYKYAELVELEKNEQLRKRYDLEIIYVFPYVKEVVKKWLDDLPAQLQKIKEWKYPAEPEKLDEQGKSRMERAQKGFPKDLSMAPGNVPTPFPILIDETQSVTIGLGLFTADWGGSKVAQLIPSVFIVDKKRILQFKYIGQNTWDRPSYEYLEKILGMMSRGE